MLVVRRVDAKSGIAPKPGKMWPLRLGHGLQQPYHHGDLRDRELGSRHQLPVGSNAM